MGPEPRRPASVRTTRGIARAITVAMTVWMALSLSLIPSSSLAAPACNLVPQLREVTINQGLGSYPKLVQGKETLVRAYLSNPSCASATNVIRITGGTLTVRAGDLTSTAQAPFPAQLTPFPLISPYYRTTPPVDSPGDPKWVVPGSFLDPTGTAAFTATFSMVVTYQVATNGTTFGATQSVSFASVSKAVERETNPLRVLVVPVGNAAVPYASQYSAAANEQVQLAMQTISRIFPVRDGTGELNATTGGVRYTVLPTLIDIRSVLDTDGLYCLRGSSFDAPIKGQLQTLAQQWETENPGIQIDVAVAVIDPAISKGGSCAQGMAVAGSSYTSAAGLAVARMTPDQGGATMAMEIAHALGLVPAGRGRAGDPSHSPVTAADAGTNRGYNVRDRSFLADDRTALYNSGTGFTNTSTLIEQLDYQFLLCALGGATTSDCANPGLIGNNVPAGPRFVMSGTVASDGLSVGNIVVAYSANVPGTPPANSGPYTLRQINVPASGPTQVLRTDFVRVSFNGTHHEESDHPAGEHPGGVVDVAVPFNSDADRIEFRNGTTVLQTFNASEVPELVSFQVVPSGEANYTQSSFDDESPTVSPDGQWVAWTRYPGGEDYSRILVGPIGNADDAVEYSEISAELDDQFQYDPAWRHDGAALAFISSGDLYTIGVDTATGAPVPDTLALVSAYDEIDGAGLYAGHPTWSPDGSQLAFDADGAIFVINATDGATGTETQLTFSGDASYPSWSQTDGDNRIAYERQPPSDISSIATLMSARRSDAAQPRGVASHGTPGEWSSHGPEGAYVAAIVSDPTVPATVYAATIGGAGIFKSTDGGGTWARSSTGLPERDVFALAMDPADPTVLYAGLERGGAAGTVWKSDDSGASWSSISDATLGGVNVSALAVDPTDSSVLYAGTGGLGVFRSNDGGLTWSGITMGLAQPFVEALSIHPTDPSIVYAATRFDAIVKSEDSGGTWTSMSSGITETFTRAVVIDPATPETVYAGSSNGVYKTINGGIDWAPTGPSSFIHSLAIEPSDPDVLYAGVSSQGLYRTVDGAASWQVANAGLLGYNIVTALAVDSSTFGTVYAGQSNAGIFKTVTGADTWTEANSGLVAWHAYAVAIDPATPSTIYTSKGAHGRAVYRSTDSAESWSPASSGLPEFNDTRVLLIDPSTPSTLYAISSGIYKSTNSGGAWAPITGTTSSVGSLALAPSVPSILYAGNNVGTVYRSINGGGSWAPTAAALPGTFIQSLAVHPTDPNTLLAVGLSTVHRSIDGGASWSLVYNPGAQCVGPSWSFSPADPSTVYGGLTCSNQVAVSSDGGASWSLEFVDSVVGSDGIYAIAADPTDADTFYAGQRDGGVHKSTDRGATWGAMTAGMLVRNVRGLAIDPVSPNVIYAATLGGGVYRLEQEVVDPPTFTVNSADDVDDGACTVAHCSLREAMEGASDTPGLDTITFDIGGSGPHNIALTDALPAITEAVVIDGTTQPGYISSPVVTIDGFDAAEANGLEIAADAVTIRGLAIADFDGAGIVVNGSSVVIESNVIGGSEEGNGGPGVRLENGAGVRVGSIAEDAGNEISWNGGDGVEVGDVANFNPIRGNSIHDNGGLGIDLTAEGLGPGGDGVTPNDIFDNDAGGNDEMNFPRILSATFDGVDTLVTGDLDSEQALASPTIDLYENSNCDDSGYGEGETYLGSFTITSDGGLDSEGHGEWSITVPGEDLGGTELTATASDVTPQTSEFSVCFPVTSDAETFTVNTTDDHDLPGGCTVSDCALREAINRANATPGVDTITFDIGGPAPYVIQVSSEVALPAITDPVVIDGTSEPDFVDGGPPVIELDGSSLTSLNEHGLRITAGSSVVRGLVIHSFSGDGIHLAGGDGNTIAGNFLGTNQAGNAAGGNGQSGIAVVDSSDNVIGGSDPADQNVISGNTAIGVAISATAANASDGNEVVGNLIGTNAAGDAAIANGVAGVRLIGATETRIGSLSEPNVISGNAGDGVLLTGTPRTTSTSIEGNIIGLNAAATDVLPNTSDGVSLTDTEGTKVGPDNVISGNLENGVEVTDATFANAIIGNLIGTNDLADPGLGNGESGISVQNSELLSIGWVDEITDGNTIVASGADGVLINGGSDNSVIANHIGLVDTGDGLEALGNVGAGVYVDNNADNRIGRDGEGNAIGANGGSGIVVDGASGTIVEGNLIGTNGNGTLDHGNAGDGITLFADVPDATIGGAATGSANRIAFNGGDGIGIESTSSGIMIRVNLIDQNGGLGIDLDQDDVTFNDLGDGDDPDTDNGANGLQNYPYLNVNGDGSLISGTLISTPDTDFDIDLYVSDACDPSDNGEAAFFAGSVAVTTNQFGYGVFEHSPDTAVGPTQVATATATGPQGTSEFSFCEFATPSGDEIWTLDPSDPTNTQELLVEDAVEPSWGTGGQIAFARDGDIHTIGSDGSAETQLTDLGLDSTPSLGGVPAFVRFLDDDSGQQDDVFLLRDQFNVVVTATDDHPDLLRLDLIYSCPGSPNYDVAVGLVPTAVTATSANWAANFDASLACPNGTLRPVLTDFWNRTAPTGFDQQITSDPQPPVAAIYVPEVGDTLLQWNALALHGSGKDADDGELLGSSLRWFINGTEIANYSAACGVTRSHCDIQPPGGAWPLPIGQNSTPLTVRLDVTDSDGDSHSDEVTIQVLRDGDEDGIPATVEATCGLSDGNPRDAFSDGDNDLYLAQDDYALGGSPCVPATFYPATVKFSPSTLYVPSSGSAVSMTVQLPLRDIRTVVRSTVKLQLISGAVVAIPNLSWSVDNKGVGTATFDRQVVIQKLQQLGLTNAMVRYTIVGTSSQGWSFEGTDIQQVKPAN